MPAEREQKAHTEVHPTASGSFGGGAGGEVKEKVQELATDTQHKVGEQLRSGVTTAKARAASNLGSIAQSLVQSSQQARQQDPEAPVQYVERAGQELQRFSQYLRDTDVNEFIRETEDFARRQPAVFLGAAFAIGLLGARFLKSSERQEHNERQYGVSGQPADLDRERPVAGYREPNAGFGDRGPTRAPGSTDGNMTDAEWARSAGGIAGDR